MAFYHLDPVTGIVEPYTDDVQNILKGKNIPSSIFLGSICFHATVHLRASGSHYQTTPAFGRGRGGKSIGHREVRRMTPRLLGNLYKKRTGDGWRFCSKSDIEAQSVQVHNLESKVAIWQWCSKSKYSYKNNDWYCYSEYVNDDLEEMWQRDNSDFELNVTTGITTKIVKVNRNEMFYTQQDKDTGNTRLVRRALMNEREVKILRDECKKNCPDDICAICISHFTENTSLPTCNLNCGHIFHQACLAPLKDKRCPMCRTEY